MRQPVLWRYLRVTSRGLLCVDKAKIAAEARLDGKTLLRTAEIAGNDIWRNLSAELDRIQLHAYDTCHGTVSQRTRLTGKHSSILDALGLPEPPRYYEFTPLDN